MHYKIDGSQTVLEREKKLVFQYVWCQNQLRVHSCCSSMRSVSRSMSLIAGWHWRIMIMTLSWSGKMGAKLCCSFSVSSAVLSLTSWPLPDPWTLPPGVQSRYCSTSVWARGTGDGEEKDVDAPANVWLPGTGELLGKY